MWWGMDAAHIFPLALEGIWKAQNYSRWISIPAVTGGPINSVQNGLLLRSDIHHLFDNYGISINPDVCILYRFYKVTVANVYLRIITRSYPSFLIGRISPASISIKRSLMILNDPLTNFYVGTSGRQS
jgi:hypothetical protein